MKFRLITILKNIIKDIRQYKKYILFMLFGDLIFASFMALNTSDQLWRLYILNGSGLISGVVVFYLYFDMLYKNDIFTCSLPINRKEILLSKYSISIIITVVGSLIFYGAASVFNSTAKFSDYYLFRQPEIIYMILCYYLTFISLILLARYSFDNFVYTIFTAAAYMVVFILIVEKLLILEGSRIPDLGYLIISLPVIILFIFISYRITLRKLKLKDLIN